MVEKKTVEKSGVSAEVPSGMKRELEALSAVTKLSASHHIRLALSRYLMSPAVVSQRAEAEKFHAKLAS